MAEEYSAGTLSADLTVDTSGLNKGITEATDGFDRLEKKLDELIGVMKSGFDKATDAVKATEEQAHHTADAMEELKEAAEAAGLYELFEKAKEMAMEAVNAFDQNNRAFMAMSASVDEIDTEKFAELAEQLSLTSRNSKATEESVIGLGSRLGLADDEIADALPTLNKFAFVSGKELPTAMQAFAMAVQSGTVQPRRMGLALDDMQKAAFKAGTEAERVGILVEAMAKKSESAGGQTKTAADAIDQFHKANEEALVSIGKMVDAPIANFFNVLAAAVRVATAAFDAIPAPVKEVLGYIAAISGAAITAGLGIAAASKALGVMSKVIGPLREVMPLLTAGFASLSATITPLLAPLAAIGAALLALAVAYGSVKNAMEGKYNYGVIEGLKEGLLRSVSDAKALLGGFIGDVEKEVEGFSGKESKEGGGLDFGAKGSKGSNSGIGRGLSDALKPGKGGALDFGTSKDAFAELGDSLRGNALDFSAAGGGIRDKHEGYEDTKDPLDAASSAFDSLNQKMDKYGVHVDILSDFTHGLTDSFSKTTDANADLMEAQAKAKDEVLQGQADEINAAGGVFTEAFAGITRDMTASERAAAMAKASPGAQAGGIVANSLAQSGGVAGQVAGDIASGGPVGLASAGMALLSQSKSFQTIMALINKTIGVLVQAINPILNAIIPALTVVLNVVGTIVTSLIKSLTPMMAPIMKLITTVMLIIKPFIEIFAQLQGILVPILTKLIVPVFNALSAALMFLAKIVIDGVVNPLIEAWDAIIDAIDDVLGWLGVDLSSLKLHTISVQDDADAVDSVTASMNQLDQSSQNIPEGYKVALSAFNAYGGSAPPAAASTPMQNVINEGTAFMKGVTATIGAAATKYMGSESDYAATYNKQNGTSLNAMGGYGAGSSSGKNFQESWGAYQAGDTSAASQTPDQIAQWLKANGYSVDGLGNVTKSTASTSKVPTSAKFAVPAGGMGVSNTSSTNNNNGSSIVIQNVSVQAKTSDLMTEMTNMLKNKGYLASGTNVMGATQRSQYGSA